MVQTKHQTSKTPDQIEQQQFSIINYLKLKLVTYVVLPEHQCLKTIKLQNDNKSNCKT